MQEKVVRLRAGLCTTVHGGEEHSADDHVREYILDMVRQLASLAGAHGEPLLGIMLDEIGYRYDLRSLQGVPPRTTTPGRTV